MPLQFDLQVLVVFFAEIGYRWKTRLTLDLVDPDGGIVSPPEVVLDGKDLSEVENSVSTHRLRASRERPEGMKSDSSSTGPKSQRGQSNASSPKRTKPRWTRKMMAEQITEMMMTMASNEQIVIKNGRITLSGPRRVLRFAPEITD